MFRGVSYWIENPLIAAPRFLPWSPGSFVGAEPQHSSGFVSVSAWHIKHLRVLPPPPAGCLSSFCVGCTFPLESSVVLPSIARPQDASDQRRMIIESDISGSWACLLVRLSQASPSQLPPLPLNKSLLPAANPWRDPREWAPWKNSQIGEIGVCVLLHSDDLTDLTYTSVALCLISPSISLFL